MEYRNPFKFELGIIYESEVAKRAGVTIKTVQNWKKGKSIPSFQKIIKLCNEFDLPLTLFVKGERNKRYE